LRWRKEGGLARIRGGPFVLPVTDPRNAAEVAAERSDLLKCGNGLWGSVGLQSRAHHLVEPLPDAAAEKVDLPVSESLEKDPSLRRVGASCGVENECIGRPEWSARQRLERNVFRARNVIRSEIRIRLQIDDAESGSLLSDPAGQFHGGDMILLVSHSGGERVDVDLSASREVWTPCKDGHETAARGETRESAPKGNDH